VHESVVKGSIDMSYTKVVLSFLEIFRAIVNDLFFSLDLFFGLALLLLGLFLNLNTI